MNFSLFFLSFILLFLDIPLPTFAAGTPLCPEDNPRFASICNLKATNGGVGRLVGTIVGAMLLIAVFVCLYYLIWGGIRYARSEGDKQQIDGARKHIIAAIIGLIVTFLVFAIFGLLSAVLGINLLNLSLPQVQ